MLNITNQQRDAIDAQVRERILREENLNASRNHGDFVPASAVRELKVSLGIGIHLENACPYMRDCDNKAPVFCIDNSYRICPSYKLRLTTDFLDGQIDLVQAGIRTGF